MSINLTSFHSNFALTIHNKSQNYVLDFELIQRRTNKFAPKHSRTCLGPVIPVSCPEEKEEISVQYQKMISDVKDKHFPLFLDHF